MLVDFNVLIIKGSAHQNQEPYWYRAAQALVTLFFLFVFFLSSCEICTRVCGEIRTLFLER